MRMLRTALGAAMLLAAPLGQGVGADSDAPADAIATDAAHAHAAPVDDPDSGADLIGAPAPEWTFTRWIGTPRSLDGLRGKVVLVRWWTEGCHFCAHTLPELEALRRKHADDGLVVIGVFHP